MNREGEGSPRAGSSIRCGSAGALPPQQQRNTDVKAVATTPIREIRQAIPAPPLRTTGSRFRTWLANFWLRYLFWHAWHAPWVVRSMKRFYLWFAVRFSKSMKHGTECNARRIFDHELSSKEQAKFTTAVVSNF